MGDLAGTVTNPFGSLLSGLVSGHVMAHQIKQQAMQEEAHQRNMAMQDREMQVQDMQRQAMADEYGRPINGGAVETGQGAQLPRADGLPESIPTGNVPSGLRPADKTRGKFTISDAGGNKRDYEYYTPEERLQKAATRQAAFQGTLEDAKTTADFNRDSSRRKLTLAAEGGGTPAVGLSAVGIPDGTRLTREEYAGYTQKVAQIRKEGMVSLKPGEKLTDVSGVAAGGAPQTIAEGGPEAATGDFGKYFLPAYTAKALKKPLAEVTPEDIKKLTPEQTQDAFTQFGSAKETPDTKAMRDMALSTSRLHQAMLQMQIGQMPTPDDAKAAAQMVVNHQISPSQVSSMFGGFGAQGQAFKRSVVREVGKLDPKFNYEESESEYNLVKSPGFQNTVRYMDSVQESIPLVIDRANKLANGNIRGVNALLNSGKNQFNGVDLKKFQTDRALVADEIAKILQGGGTGAGTSDAKLKQAGEILKDSDSPRAISAAMGEVQQLIGYRRHALTRGTYMQGTQAGGGSAEKPAAPSGQFQVTDPNGGVHTFKDQASADAFKNAAGIK